MIEKAIAFATKAHKGQVRKYNGDPYIVHPLRVAGMFAYYVNHDSISPSIRHYGQVVINDGIVAALLHDVVEDCDVSLADIWIDFNHNVADMVDGLTNYSHRPEFRQLPRAERKRLDREWLKEQHPIVKMLKIVDRYDNLLDMGSGVETDGKFIRLYVKESAQLINAIGDAHPAIADLILEQGEKLIKSLPDYVDGEAADMHRVASNWINKG